MTARPGHELRNAALAYAARGIPVLPLHHPVTRASAGRPVPAGQPPEDWSRGCSCGDRACAQPGKHPLGQLVPHGLTEATTNRARVLAWWTAHPQANIGLACGHRFDVLDLDGPTGITALQAFADQHGVRLPATGPVVRSGRSDGGWHYYLAPSGLPRRARVLDGVDYQALGGYVVAPPSRHATGQRYTWARDLAHPLPTLPGVLHERLVERAPPARPVPTVSLDREGVHPWAHAALAAELGRLAAAPPGRRNDQLWESGRNLFNLVASGALDQHEVEQGLLDAAGRCGLLHDEPGQTRRTLASAREVGLAHPRRPPLRPAPERTNAPPPPRARDQGERTRSPEGR